LVIFTGRQHSLLVSFRLSVCHTAALYQNNAN